MVEAKPLQTNATAARRGKQYLDNTEKPDPYALLKKHTGYTTLKGKTLFITGASRGIGLAIALRAAVDGANVVIAAKSAKEDPRLPGTIYSAAEEIRAAGGQALPIQCDIRFEDQVKAAVEAGVKQFGGIDICINNASAISLTTTEQTDMKRYDLMHHINTRGTFVVSKACLPYLKKSKNPHILNISPPLNMEEKWFSPHVAYTMAKFGMSMCALGMAGEFRDDGIAVNTLWPLTMIATAAVKNLLGGGEAIGKSRTPEVFSDAAYHVLTANSKHITGNFFVDEDVLRAVGVTNFSKYAVTPGMSDEELGRDFFV
jgi:citronellol/citronellal dehydrogenase